MLQHGSRDRAYQSEHRKAAGVIQGAWRLFKKEEPLERRELLATNAL